VKVMRSPALGSIARAVPYVMGPVDARQRVRTRVELLRGDPDLLIDLVNTLPVSPGAGPGSAYDSVVLAFSPLDQPSREQIRQVVALLPTVLFPGLGDRVCWMAQLHSDGTTIHLHVLCARVDLVTGLQFSLRGLALRPLKEFCRYLNLHHGWADSSDECRGRLAWWPRDVELPGGLEVHAQARALAIAAVLEGRVDSQAGMGQVLQPLGRVVGTGRHSITLDVAGMAPRGPRGTTTVRLTGLLYSRPFNRAGALQLLAPSRLPVALRRRYTPPDDPWLLETQQQADARQRAKEVQQAAALFTKLQRNAARRAADLLARYAVKAARASRSLVTRLAWEVGLDASHSEIDLRRRRTASRSTPTLVSIPTTGALHDPNSPTDRPVHAHRPRPVSAGTDPVAGRPAFAADLAWMGRTMLDAARAWVHDSLVPQVLEGARRAVGAAFDNILGAPDPNGRHGRLESASGALAGRSDEGVGAATQQDGQGRLGTGSDADMSQLDGDEPDEDEEAGRPRRDSKRRPRPGKRW
jgi:hypothetical protein